MNIFQAWRYSHRLDSDGPITRTSMLQMKQIVLWFSLTTILAIHPKPDVARDRINTVQTTTGLPLFVIVLAADSTFMKEVAPGSTGWDLKKDST